jgi:hypothetical protein
MDGNRSAALPFSLDSRCRMQQEAGKGKQNQTPNSVAALHKSRHVASIPWDRASG